jgi:hypothetical protein
MIFYFNICTVHREQFNTQTNKFTIYIYIYI